MAREGWIKLHRKLLDNPVTFKDPDYLAVWIFLLLEATHKEQKRDFGGKIIILKPGQLITGRPAISKQTKVQASKVERILKRLKSEQQIEQQTSTKGRLITILNWNEYQNSEQENEQQVNNNRTTSEQQVNTNKNVKNVNNVKNDNTHIDTDSINSHVTQDSADLSKHEKKCVDNKSNADLDNNSSADLDNKINVVEQFFSKNIKQNLLSANDMISITEACEKYSLDEIMKVMQGIARSNANVNSFNYIKRILDSPKKPKSNKKPRYYKPAEESTTVDYDSEELAYLKDYTDNNAEIESIKRIIKQRGK